MDTKTFKEAIFHLTDEEKNTLRNSLFEFILDVLQNRQCYYETDAVALAELIRLFR